ncbi:MAG: hypothetical protein KKE53_18490 [Proteobacteria bacterium]|nr:hypothetical protein [Pseudomonadota bacterium]
MKRLTENHVAPLLTSNEDLALSGEVSTQSIDYLSRQIIKIDKTCQDRVKLNPQYSELLTIPGIGNVLALTIMLETGPTHSYQWVTTHPPTKKSEGIAKKA